MERPALTSAANLLATSLLASAPATTAHAGDAPGKAPKADVATRPPPGADAGGDPQREAARNAPAPPRLLSPDRRTARNAVYVEVAGPAGAYSLNYDRMITDDVAARIGVSHLPFARSSTVTLRDGSTVRVDSSLLAIPLSISYVGLGSLDNMLELGAGVTFFRVRGDALFDARELGDAPTQAVTLWALTPLAGYRHQAPAGGFVFRAGVSPMIVLDASVSPRPWGYASFGAGF